MEIENDEPNDLSKIQLNPEENAEEEKRLV